MLEVGMKHSVELVVDKSKTAAAAGSGGLEVFGTPYMIAQKELDDSQGTVGISISTNHKAATPMGMKVTCEAELVEIDRSRLVFNVVCSDELDVIGEGQHQRFIIDNEKFLAGVNAKIDKAKNK